MKPKLSTSSNARLASVLLLEKIFLEASSLSQSNIYFQNLSPKDKGFAQALCYGVCRYYFELDAYLSKRLNKKLKRKDFDVLAVLFIGSYQLLYMRTPEHAAINSSVELCRTLKKNWACKLVNAVLRNLQRSQKNEAEWQQEKNNFTNSQKYLHPDWLIAQLKQDWPNNYQDILENNNQQAPMYLRINPQSTRQAYQVELEQNDIASELCTHAPQGLRLRNAVNFEQLPQVENGLVSVQDEAAQLAAHILTPQAGELVLDACAAPGGKTAHLLELANSEVIALDIDAQRCQKIEETLERLGLSAAIHIADAANTDDWWDGRQFDRILLDAPCSATGVIRRHPDIKLLRRATDIPELVNTQTTLLQSLWPLLKPGGQLLYATCSILRQENEANISTFLNQHSDAKTVTIDIQKDQQYVIALTHGIQLLPTKNGPDGFYYALIKKHQN